MRIFGKVKEKGYTLVPLKIYFKNALVKVEVALVKGKQNYDKKQSIMQKGRGARHAARHKGVRRLMRKKRDFSQYDFSRVAIIGCPGSGKRCCRKKCNVSCTVKRCIWTSCFGCPTGR